MVEVSQKVQEKLYGEAIETVDHPPHYNAHPSGVECIDVIEHMNFNLGSAMKYIWRHKEKKKPVEDLRKAMWYIEREINRIAPSVNSATGENYE